MNNPKSFRAKLHAWFRTKGRELPWRRTRDPYAVLVSEMMLQQTQVATVIDYFERWMERFPTMAVLANATEAEVLHAWQGLGYYSRARNLHRAVQTILREHGGVFPRELEAIRALPGIGRYTAGAVASFAFDRSTPIVDANIARVLSRLTNYQLPIDTTAGQEHLWNSATELLPPRGAGLHNSAIMELGALICLPKPRCQSCPVHEFCQARDPERLPVKRPRPKTVTLSETCGLILSRGRILLQQETGKRWHGLWRLPSVTAKGTPLITLQYPITRYRVTLLVFSHPAPSKPGPNQAWFPITGLNRVPMPSPHRRALETTGSLSA